MRRRLLISYLLLTAVLLIVLEVPLAISQSRSERQTLQTRVERDAVAMAGIADEALSADTAARRAAAQVRLDAFATAYAKRTDTRVVVVDQSGISIVDTGARAGRDFSTRPEIATALGGAVASGVRASKTLGYSLLYVAVPAATGGTLHGAVRVSAPTHEVDERVRGYRTVLGAVAVLVLLVAAIVGLTLARWVGRPLDGLRRAASGVDGGDLSARAPTDQGPPELRQLADEFNAMVARLETVVTAQRRFTGDASHQLRTPLAAMRLRLENMQSTLDADGASRIDDVIAETERLDRLVDGLLSLARADEASSRPVTVDLAALVRERVAEWQGLADERGVTVTAHAPDSALVHAVEGALEQVIDNLIDNALDASSSGCEVDVHVGSRADGGDVVDDEWTTLQVIDDGRGIAAEEAGRAFDRFWRSGDAPAGGSGIGLAIVQQLVELGGGSVELAPRDDAHGTVATVTLRTSR